VRRRSYCLRFHGGLSGARRIPIHFTGRRFQVDFPPMFTQVHLFFSFSLTFKYTDVGYLVSEIKTHPSLNLFFKLFTAIFSIVITKK